MKRTKKTPPRVKARRDNEYGDENIFNPFSPLFVWLKRAPRKKREYSEHPFRDSFITVVLLHIIAVLSFFAYGTLKDVTKTPTAGRATKDQKDSRVARILEKQPTLLPSEGAEPGEKLLAVREPNRFPTERLAETKTKPAESAKTTRAANTAITPFATDEESLPPLAVAPKPAAKQEPAVGTSSARRNDPVKKAFLAASGRLSQAEQEATVTEPEARKAEPVAKTQPAPSTPEQAVTPVVSEYTVQPGDNIFTISRRMNVSFTELAAANNLSGPRDVRVGQVLVSPNMQRDSM